MKGYLLDVNVLIALVLENHEAHPVVRRWFQETGVKHWVTCALTQGSFVRIVSNPKFSQPSLNVDDALEMLDTVTRLPGHHFWPMDVGVLEAVNPFAERLFGHQQVTDAYLLGMAVRKAGRFVTLDKAILALAGEAYSNHVLTLQ